MRRAAKISSGGGIERHWFAPNGQQLHFAAWADVDIEDSGAIFDFKKIAAVRVGSGGRTLGERLTKSLNAGRQQAVQRFDLRIAFQLQSHKASLNSILLLID